VYDQEFKRPKWNENEVNWRDEEELGSDFKEGQKE